MIWNFITDMLRTPEAQHSAYIWAAALLGHFAVGIAATAVAGWVVGAWRGASIVSIGYLLLWEGAQVAFFGGGVADGLVDAAAVACGAVVAAGAWRNRGMAVGAAMAVLVAIGLRGVKVRR